MHKSINAWMDDILTAAAETVIQAHGEKPAPERAQTKQLRELAPI
jgi:ribosomal protein S10